MKPKYYNIDTLPIVVDVLERLLVLNIIESSLVSIESNVRFVHDMLSESIFIILFNVDMTIDNIHMKVLFIIYYNTLPMFMCENSTAPCLTNT